MKTEASIRDFRNFSTAELFAIFRHIYLTSDFMSDDFDRKFPNIESFSKHYQDVLRKPGSFILIANDETRPVGYLVVEANDASRLCHTAWLNMGVSENSRGKGFGKFMLTQALERAKSEGRIEIVYLMVRADHAGAIRLYRTSGFDEMIRLERDTKIGNDYFDGILMRKFIRVFHDNQ